MNRNAAVLLLSMGLFSSVLPVTSCGGGGTSGSQTVTPTVSSVAASCTPTSVPTGQTSQCSAVVSGTGAYSSAVTWAAVSGTISSSGVYTAPATVPSSGSDTIKATSTQDTTKSGSATVTVIVPVTITSVAVACSPTSIFTTQTSSCAPTVTGTGSYSTSVTWSVSPATIGSVSGAGVFTPTATGTATIKATSAQDSSKSGTANVTVAVPIYTAQSGVAQKGPLIMGSTISVQELSQTLSPTGKQYSFLTTSNLGTFTPNASFGSNLLSTSATGYYYDENLNAISAGPITLEAYSDLTADTVIDVNVLSTLAYQRISTLVAGGSSIDAARQQAEMEVLATFHIRNAESYPDFSQLDLSQTGNANNILAALSSVLDYGETSGNLASLVATFQSDIAGTGTMTDANTLATIAASSKSVVPATIAANLNTKYASESLALTATNISSWIDQDGDGVIGKFKFYQLNATPSTAYTSPKYTAGPDDDGTLASVSEGTLLVNGSAVSSSGAVVHNGDVLTIQLTSSANLDYPVTSYILSNGLKIARFTVTTTPLAVSTGSGIGNNGIPSGVQVTDDGNTLLLVSFDTCTVSGGGTCAAPSNGGLYTYSLATPSSPALEGHTYQVYSPYVWAGYYQVAYSSITHSAFVADSGAYLQSFNVSTPSSPTFESGAYVTCQGMSVVLSLDKSSAFITDSCGGVSQFDISNPNSMTLISSTSINSQARYTAISPDGQQLLLFNQGYVAVVDISTGKLGTVTVISQNSVLSGSTNGAQGFANGVYIGNRSIALVAPSGVSIFDVTTPSAPTIVGSLSFATQQASSGTVAYAATYVKSTGLTYLVANNTFYVLNASAPASPYIEGSATLQIGSGSSVGSDSASISTTSDGSVAYVVSQGMVNVVSIP